MNDPRIEKLNLLWREMLKYILEHSPDDTDTIEAYWYLRWARDTAFEMWVMSDTTLYDDVQKAAYHLFDI